MNVTELSNEQVWNECGMLLMWCVMKWSVIYVVFYENGLL